MNREDHFIQLLKDSPEDELWGVVDAGGVSGVGSGPSGREIQWMVHVQFAAWRPVGGLVRTTVLNVRKPVPEAQIGDYMAAMRPYDVVRVKARWLEDPATDTAWALIGEVLGKQESDADLRAQALRLQKPVTFKDADLGKFTLDRSIGMFEADTKWCGGFVSLRIEGSSVPDAQNALRTARSLWAEQTVWDQRIKTFSTEQMLELKNNNWLEDDEQEITPEEFASRIEVTSIFVNADGSFKISCSDDGMFHDHWITVHGDESRGLYDAGLGG